MDLGHQMERLATFVTAAHWRTVEMLCAPTLATRAGVVGSDNGGGHRGDRWTPLECTGQF